jgi:hypothetical protein
MSDWLNPVFLGGVVAALLYLLYVLIHDRREHGR